MNESDNKHSGTTHSVLRTIASDVHFWIPLCVLIAGLFLLHELH